MLLQSPRIDKKGVTSRHGILNADLTDGDFARSYDENTPLELKIFKYYRYIMIFK